MRTETVIRGKAEIFEMGFRYETDYQGIRQTKCVLRLPECGVEWTGTARCSKEDQFEKSRGRKIALKRVLEKLRFNKEQRTAFWKTYWEHHRR